MIAALITIALVAERVEAAGGLVLFAVVAVTLPGAIIVLALYGAPARTFALALGAALWTFVGLAPIAVTYTLFIGFAMGDNDTLLAIALLDAVVLLQIPLAIAGIVGYRRLATEHRGPNVWPSSLGIPLVVLVAVAGIWQLAVHQDASRQQTVFANEQAARDTIERARTCLQGYRIQRATFPATLTELRAGCLDETLGDGALPGHELTYYAGAADARGVIHLFGLCARARDVNRTALRTYVADEFGTGTHLEPSPDMIEPYTCAQAWGDDALRRVKFCLTTYAAMHGTYPADLMVVGAAGNGCLAAPMDTRNLVAGSRYMYRDSQVDYSTADQDPDGRITRFELSSWSAQSDTPVAVMIDETGAVHAAANRAASRKDVPLQSLIAELAARQASTEQENATLKRACESIDTQACLAYAREIFAADRLEEADVTWQRACEAGNQVGCLFASRTVDYSLFALAMDDDRACELGEQHACEALESLATAHHDCADHAGAACSDVALRHYAARDGARAQSLWKRGCQGGHIESCYFSRLGIDLRHVVGLYTACLSGSAAQCDELERRMAAAVPRPAN